MSFRSPKTSKQFVQDVSPQRARGKISSSKGKSPAHTQTINSSASPSNAARLSRNASKLTSEAAGSGSVEGHHSMEQFRKGTPAGRARAASAQQGRSQTMARIATQRSGLSQLSGPESPRGLSSRKSRSVSIGIRYKAESSDEEWPGSSNVKVRGRAQRQKSGISTVTRNHSESLQPARTEEGRTKGSAAAGKSNTASSSSLKSGGRNGQRQSVTQTQPSTGQVVPLKRSARPVKRKNSDRTYTAQNQSLSHSSLVLHCPKAEPPSKRTRFSDGQTTVEVSQMPRGKKSLLRRAQEDMLVSSSTVSNKSSSKTTAVKSKTSLSETSNSSKPLTRHSLHTASSTKLQNYRFPVRVRRPVWSWSENGAARQEFHETGSAANPDSEMPTQGRKKGAVKLDGAAYNPGNGLSPSQAKVRRTESREAVHSTPVAGPSGISGGSMKALHHTHVHGVGGRKAGQQNEVDTARLPVAARLRTPTTKQCEKGKGKHCAQNCDRPRRSLSKRKKCECCEHDSDHSDSSISDTELPRKAGKDEDRAWRSSIRSSRPKLKAKRSQFSSSKNVSSNVSSPTEVITYIKYPVYPVKLHSSSFAQELPLSGAALDSGKEEIKMEESQTPDSGVKDEAESPCKSELVTFNQDAKQPGDIVFVDEDFYVVVADSDDEEETMDMLAKDLSADDIKPELKNTVIRQKEEPDFKTDGGLHSAASVQKEDEKLAPATTTFSQEEGCAVQVEPAAVSAQKEEKGNEPATAQSDSLHSQGEQISSATTQNAQLFWKSEEARLTLEEKESYLQNVETLASEVKVSNDKKETEMQQDLLETLTVQQEGCRHTEHNFETTVTSQTHHAAPCVVSSEKEPLSTPSPQEAPCTQAPSVSSPQEGESGDQMHVGKQENVEQTPTVDVSTTEESLQTVFVPQREDHTVSGKVVELVERSDDNMKADITEQSQQTKTDGKISQQKDQTETVNVALKTSGRDETALDADIPLRSDQVQGNTARLSTGEDIEQTCRVSLEAGLTNTTDFVQGCFTAVEDSAGGGSEVATTFREVPDRNGAGVGSNVEQKANQGGEATKSDREEDHAESAISEKDPSQEEQCLNSEENPVQAEVAVPPTHSCVDQTCDTSCEDKEVLEQCASRQIILQQSSTSTAVGGDEGQPSLNSDSSENSEAGCMDFVAARNVLQENNLTVSKDMQSDPVQLAKAEGAMPNTDQTATILLEHEECSEGFPQIQETCDNRLGQVR